jgi:mono/diheme cytochrome c family protein
MTRLLLVASLAVAAGCGSPRRSEPLVGPLVVAGDAARGERVFMAECHSCHPGGEGGTGPSLNDKPAPAFLIRFQVRRGLGAMPAFPREKIDDGALDDLVAYVVALRRHGGPPRNARGPAG